MSGYIFSSYLPQGKTTYTIKASKDVELFYKVVNDPQKQIQFHKTEKGGQVSYEWSVENLPSIQERRSQSVRSLLRATCNLLREILSNQKGHRECDFQPGRSVQMVLHVC